MQYSFSSLRSPSDIFSATTSMGSFRSLFANRRLSRDTMASETILSYDSGDSWLEPRATLLNGENCTTNTALVATGGCRLHFYAAGDSEHHFSDASEAAGLALATGNLGTSLSTNASMMSSFLSRDGGFSWKKIRDGSNLVAMSPKAQTMLIMSDTAATDTFVASFDVGSKWSECRLSANVTSFLPAAVITDPADAVPRFLLLGSSSDDVNSIKSKRNIMVQLLFKPEMSGIRNCTYPDDYEPRVEHGLEHCILGRHLQIMAKKSNSTCSDTDQGNLRIFWQACPCTEQDFICDPCFSSSGGKCYFSRALCPDHILASQLFTCSGFITSTYTGYQKNPTSFCEGGKDLSVGIATHQCSTIVVYPTPQPTYVGPRLRDDTPAPQDAGQAESRVVTAILASVFGGLLFILVVLGICGFLVRRSRQNFPTTELGNADLSSPSPAPEEPNPFMSNANSVRISLEMSE
jgi:hypothetical protein